MYMLGQAQATHFSVHGLAHSLHPVSYTHLDVYKRQGQYLVNAYDQSSAVVSNGKVTFNSGKNGTIPVSYTHL